MRISLTALTPRGPQDVVINGDSDMTVASVASSLQRILISGNTDESQQITAEILHLPHARTGPGVPDLAGGPGPSFGGGRGSAAAADVRLGGEPPSAGTDRRPLWTGGRMLDPQAPAARELADGAIVTVEPSLAPATVLAEPSGPTEIRVVGGPYAGAVHRLGLGMTTLGGGPDADIRIEDPALAARPLRITVERERVRVEVPGDAAGAALDGRPLGRGGDWPAGAMLTLGSTVLTVASSVAPDAHLEPLPQGGLAYQRPPRGTPYHRPRRLEVPSPPEHRPRDRRRLLGVLLLSAAGLVMALALRQWWWALLALSWPAAQAGERAADRLHGRAPYKKALKEYQTRSARFGGELDRLRREDEAARRALFPDPAEVLLTATGPRHRLWERRAGDPDALQLRVGLADLPADLELVGAGPAEPSPEPPLARQVLARSVPVTLPLADLRVAGLAGPRGASRGLARWLVAQAAALHSPRDLAIVVLSLHQDAADEWNWVRWLPHVAPRNGEECVALVGTDLESVAHRITELAIRITERRRAAQSVPGMLGTMAREHDILLVLDGARALRRLPGMPQVLARGPEYGVHAICVDDEEGLLPEECAAVAVWDRQRPETLRLLADSAPAVPVLADQVSPAWCERLARALAPVRDVSDDDAVEEVPASARLLDLLGMPEPTPAQVLNRWDDTLRWTRVPIGAGTHGIVEIDLHDEGPHVLVTGTTGSGKSELLRTLVASLAVANRPDEMAFVLIGGEGGAAFAECAELPHTVGVITDLDGHLALRALSSLTAELRRRQAVLSRAGTEDLEEYDRLRTTGGPRPAGLEPLPRLVLAVDEPADLDTAAPGFAAGLAEIGDRGGSLGVHLIVAARRPGDPVVADLRAHTGLRVALRTADEKESSDVLGSPEAAHIPRSAPGRCYLASGPSAPQAVQAARTGGPQPGRGRTGARAAAGPAIPVPWHALGRPLPGRPASAEDETTTATDLAVLVEAVRTAATRAGVARRPSPWPEPLPAQVVLRPRQAAGGSPIELPPIEFGLTDLPEAQTRAPLTLDLAEDGNVHIVGDAGSGRSTALRTLAGCLASACSPYDVHLYAVDCAGGALSSLGSLPHCGAVVGHDRPERVERLVAALTTELSRRRRLLAEAGFSSLAEQRALVASPERLPWIVLLLDGWEGFLAAFENADRGHLVDMLLRLLREGGSVGLRAVFTGDRPGLTGPLSAVAGKRLFLRTADAPDGGRPGRHAGRPPSAMPPGRVLEPLGSAGPARESQIGLLAADPSDTAQAEALREIGRAAARRFGDPPPRLRPLRVEDLPVRVTYDEALALGPGFLAPSPLWCLAGVGGDTLAPVGVDLLADGPGFVVAGPPGSGRSTALLTLTCSLLDPAVAGGLVPVAVITPGPSPLRGLAGLPGVLGVLDGSARAADLEALIADEHRCAVVVDDAELLGGTELDDALCRVLNSAADGERAVILGGTASDLGRVRHGFAAEARRSRSALLLSATSSADGEPFGLRPPSHAREETRTGRGLLATSGTTTGIQVALPPGDGLRRS